MGYEEGTSDATLLQVGVDRLKETLPPAWEVDYLRRGGDQPDVGVDAVAMLTINSGQHGGAYGQLLVQAKSTFGPLDVPRLAGGPLAMIRQAVGQDTAVLVVAPWLSRRSRELLEEAGVGYLDLTGNTLLVMDRPGLVVRVSGSEQDPDPVKRRAAGLAGPQAGRLVRLLADVKPPYRPAQLADVSELSRPYVSRLLEALQSRALVHRTGAAVTRVDWVGLLRARAERYSVLKANQAWPLVSTGGADEVLQRLRADPALASQVTVTGSAAAAAVAPVTVGGQLMLYAANPMRLASDLDLMPARSGANVILLKPADPGTVARPREVDGLEHVGLSQLVLDCLSGNGRMPAEGEAVLKWMQENEADWRLPSLADLFQVASRN